jgi:hypothetical protein
MKVTGGATVADSGLKVTGGLTVYTDGAVVNGGLTVVDGFILIGECDATVSQ